MRVVVFILLIILVIMISFINYYNGFKDGLEAAANVIDEEIQKKEEEQKDDIH